MFNSRIGSGVPARAVGVWNYWLRLRATSREWLGESAEVAHCCDGLRALRPDGTPLEPEWHQCCLEPGQALFTITITGKDT